MSILTDQRNRELARLLITYSVHAGPGDLVMIHCFGQDTLPLGAACLEEAIRVGAAPYLQMTEPEISRKFLLHADEKVMQRLAEFEKLQMSNAACYLGIRGSDNIFEFADVPSDQMKLYNRLIGKPVHLDIRVKKTRWCVLRYPNSSMAQLAGTSREKFADFYYSVCCVDYPGMAEAVKPLKAWLEKADCVRIVGPGETDLSFSIKEIPVKPCCGGHNIPDGECYTAPVLDSVEGVVQFNTPTVHEGVPYDKIRLQFEKGRVVEASGANEEQTRKLNEVLDQDKGARSIGEWSLGFNPSLLEPIRDILFDEKIAGSFHLALGQCYDEAPNGNDSALHWDLVCIQRPEYGGGEIYLDDMLIRKDGIFLPEQLKGLNPESFS